LTPEYNVNNHQQKPLHVCVPNKIMGSHTRTRHWLSNNVPKPTPPFGVIRRGLAILGKFDAALHRLGMFGFVGFSNAPDTNTEYYCTREIAMGLSVSSGELRVHWDSSFTGVVFAIPRLRYIHAIVGGGVLSLFYDLLTELPPLVPTNKAEQTQQAKLRLYREVIHRLASGPKTQCQLSERAIPSVQCAPKRCESYLATVSHREERKMKRDESRCPLCQRLLNCCKFLSHIGWCGHLQRLLTHFVFLHLVIAFIDVGDDSIESPPSTRLSEGGQSPCNAKFDEVQVDKVLPKSMYCSVPKS
jgi:hypothetical protein